MTPKQILRSLRGAVLGYSEVEKKHDGLFPTTIQIHPKRLYTLLTSTYTFLLALLGVAILSPIMLTIAIAVKLSSPGPALYRGKRVGRNKVPFDILKFRTMKVGSEAKIGKRLSEQDIHIHIGHFEKMARRAAPFTV